MSLVLIGTVDSSYRLLQTLTDLDAPVSMVLSLAPADELGVSDYVDLGPLAAEHNIPQRYIKKVNSPEVLGLLKELAPSVIMVIGWSQLVRNELLCIPKYGCIGAHPALLPRNRGRAVIPWAIIRDEPQTGMTLFYIDEGMDSGDIIDQVSLPLTDLDDAQTVYDRAVDALCQMVRIHLPTILNGSAPRHPQDVTRATYCARRRPEDGLIDWSRSTREVFNLVRAVTRPYPGAFTYYRGRLVTVWRALPGEEAWTALPGQVLRLDPERGVLIKTGDGTLWLTELAVDGETENPSTIFKSLGEKLGAPDVLSLMDRIRKLESEGS